MKRIVYSLLVAGLTILNFTSCENDKYRDLDRRVKELDMELDSKTSRLENVLANYKSVEVSYITIRPENWVTSGEEGSENCYMYAEVECTLITQNIINDGVVLAYYVDADNRDNVLPYIQSYLPEAPSTDMVIETFRYDAEVGKITFIIQNSDYSFHERLGDIQFKIATIY